MSKSLQFDHSRYTFYEVGKVDELPEGERLFVGIGDQHIAVFNVNGEYAAIRDVCTHDDGTLGEGDLEGFEIVCPRHGARFDIRTGKALTLPAVDDTEAFPVRVVGDAIEVGIPL